MGNFSSNRERKADIGGFEYNFRGAFPATLDAKNRVMVPADLRRKLYPERDGDALIVNVALDNRIWLFPENYYPRVVERAQREVKTDEQQRWFDLYYYAQAIQLKLDDQFRVVLPADLVEEVGLDKDIYVIGVGDHLEVWNASDWMSSRKNVREQLGKLGLSGRKPLDSGALGQLGFGSTTVVG